MHNYIRYQQKTEYKNTPFKFIFLLYFPDF